MLPAPLTSSLQRRMRGEPASIERLCVGGDVGGQAALWATSTAVSRALGLSEQMATTEPFARELQSRRAADQEDHRDDAMAAARDFAASFAIELAVKEGDGMAGEHDGMVHVAKDRRISPDNPSIARSADEQEQSVLTPGIIMCSGVAGRPDGTNNDRDGGADLRARQP